jgi:hypothetical protein
MRIQICRSRLTGERGQPSRECIAARSPSRASALLQVIGAPRATFGTRKIRRSERRREPSAYAKICRSRLAGERGQPGHECVVARSSSRVSALLQVIGATPATFGVRKIQRSGDTDRLRRTQKTVNPGDTGDLSRTQNPATRLTPPTFGVRKICRSRLAGERGEPGHECIAARPPCRCRSALAREGGEPGERCTVGRSSCAGKRPPTTNASVGLRFEAVVERSAFSDPKKSPREEGF